MKRSARSTPTGPGSRGGRWGHHPPAEYYRLWRATHPEYRHREVLRRAAAKRAVRLQRDREWVDALVGGKPMPWDVKKSPKSGYDIVDKGGKVVGHSETKAKAEASVRARYANTPEAQKKKGK